MRRFVSKMKFSIIKKEEVINKQINKVKDKYNASKIKINHCKKKKKSKNKIKK